MAAEAEAEAAEGTLAEMPTLAAMAQSMVLAAAEAVLLPMLSATLVLAVTVRLELSS
jgi:hypothetical protein